MGSFAIEYLRAAGLAVETHVARLRAVYTAALGATFLTLALLWWVCFTAPAGFPTGQYLTVAPGTSVGKAGEELRQAHVIASPLLFKLLVRFTSGAHGVQSGVYQFEKPVGVVSVAWRLAHGISGIPTIKVTLPEGMTVVEMAEVLEAKLPSFDKERFIAIARPAEGYLFPDTYFFLPNATETEVLYAMGANFNSKWERLDTSVDLGGLQKADIVTMASLLEGEGKTLEDRRMIAGILWHRLQIGMPLQVDAAFGYVHGISGYAPTATDLRSDTRYNTYQYKGLPPSPIDNPGYESLLAAATPQVSDYLYYLTGKDGTMHYAKTYAEHQENQRKYLK